MCIICRQRALKSKLLRFSIQNLQVVKNPATGRGSYVCAACMDKEERILVKSLNRFMKNNVDKTALIASLRGLAEGNEWTK